MSYPYRVVVSKTVEEVIDCDDRVVTKISLTPILPKEAMREVLKDVLVARGWKEKPGEPGKLTRTGKNGEEETFDLETLEIETKVAVKETIKKEKTIEVVGDAWKKDDIDAEKDRLRAKAGADLEKRVAEQLSSSEQDRKKDLNEALLQVYAEALKKKAASLGNVTSVKEERRDGGREYELTIKVAE